MDPLSYPDENEYFSLPIPPRNARIPSPYLDVDPALFPSSPSEYNLLEGRNKQRGRFELAFSQIGGSFMVGAMVGGSGGFYNGVKETSLAGQLGKLRQTKVINHVMKQGVAKANALGSIAVMYSGFGVILAELRETEDELNTLVSATTTGLIYRSTAGVSAGLRASAVGGAVGLGIASMYCLWTSRDRMSAFFSREEHLPFNKR